MERSKRSYWEALAGRGATPPLPPPSRPSGEDIAGFEAGAMALAATLDRAPDVLILGLTRGIVSMHWPKRSSLVAMDWSGAMLRRVWPESSLPAAVRLVIGDWRQMPVADGSVDLAIGDGCLASQNSFADCAEVIREVWRVLRPGGRFVHRCFSRPDAAENVDRLFEELRAGVIPAFEQFRWRLAMALHPPGEGVLTARAWREWRDRVEDPRALCARLGWSATDASSIDAWNTRDVRVPLPTLGELAALWEGRFVLLERRIPAYPMGARFPTLVLRRLP